MKSKLQTEYQSEGSELIHKFILRNLSEDSYVQKQSDHDDDDDNPTKKVIIIIISLCIGILIFGVMVYICRCIYVRKKNQKIAQVRQQSEVAYQSQNLQLELVSVHEENLMECPICLSPIPSFMKIVTICNHQFHQACLNRWLLEGKICPVCRNAINN